MAKPQPLEIFSARDLRNQSGKLLRDASEGRLSLITKHGRPVFLAVPFGQEILEHGLAKSLAVSLFEAGQTTLAQSARIAGLSLGEMIDLLGELQIPAVDYPPEEIEEELAVAL